MMLAKVIGTATATVKHPSLSGTRMLIVQPQLADGSSADGDPLIAVDRLGAARGELVIITSDGRGARAMVGTEKTPIRWTVMGIQD